MPLLQHLVGNLNHDRGGRAPGQVGSQAIAAGDALELGDDVHPAALSQQHLAVGEDIELAAHPALGPPNRLGDGRELAALTGEEGEDPVRLTVVDLAQDHRLGAIDRHRRRSRACCGWLPAVRSP